MTYLLSQSFDVDKFQSTLPSRGVTQVVQSPALAAGISIHTPLAGSDFFQGVGGIMFISISIHTPLAGSDSMDYDKFRSRFPFQSTLPSRGVTVVLSGNADDIVYFNPHSPRGE